MFFTDIEDKRFKPSDPPKKIKTLLDKAATLEKKSLTLLEEFDRRIKDPEKSMLELGLTIDNKPDNKKKRRRKIVEDKIDVVVRENSDEDPHEKLLYFAKKYLINPVGQSGKKTYKQIADEVYKYEIKNRKKLIHEGVDKKYIDYGYYIKLV
jgi:hypothetical protein